MDRPSYVVITPVRNEAEYVSRTIASMVQQTILPRAWVIVDDGSSDGTSEILGAAVANYPWITVVRCPDRGFRKSGGGVVEAFYHGYAALREHDWDFIVKLDGDLSFESDYFETCLALFAADPELGLGGGTICVLRDDHLVVDSPTDPPFHVRGATKIYRRDCWERIRPLPATPGWDTVDEVKANMHGWKTRTFPAVRLVQHKPTGAADGAWPNMFKNGVGCYVAGYHPVFMLAKCVKRIFQTSPLAAVALCTGYSAGYLRRLPRVEPNAVRYLRRQQLLRLLARPSIYGSAATRRVSAFESTGSEDREIRRRDIKGTS